MGEGHVLALKTDGTVLAAGDNSNEQCDVSGWTDIIAVYAQKNTSFGLRADGTVVTAGPLENGMEKIKTWRDMKMLAFGTYDKKPFALGVKRDGSLSVVGDRLTTLLASKRAAGKDLIWKEKNRFVAAGENILFGGILGGTMKGVGIDYDGSRDRTAKWEDVEAVTCGAGCTYGIRKDGVILRAGFNKGDRLGDSHPLAESLNLLSESLYLSDQVSYAKDELPILFELSWGVGVIAASYHHFLAADGTVYERREGQLDPEKWHDIVAIADCGGISSPMAGIRADGTLVIDGELEDAVKDWNGLYVAPGHRETILRRIVERMEEDEQHWEEEQRRM